MPRTNLPAAPPGNFTATPRSRQLSPGAISSTTTSRNHTPTVSPTRRVSFHSSVENFRKSTKASEGSSADLHRTAVEPRGRPPADNNDVESDDEATGMVSRQKGVGAEGERNYNTMMPSTQADVPQQSARKRKGSTRSTRSGEQGSDHDQVQDSPGQWKKWAEKYGSIELENKGSVARDHLALERTFLAWLRTSLSFASIGIAITQLFRLNTTLNQADPSAGQIRLQRLGQPLGATFIAIGIVTLVLGFHRYFESQHYVIRGKFPASRGSIIILSFIAGILIIASFVVILVVNSTIKHNN